MVGEPALRPAKSRGAKSAMVAPLAALLRLTYSIAESGRRLFSHASLAARLRKALPASVVVLGRASVYGTCNVVFGEDVLLYPGLHLETQDAGSIVVGNGVVISRGVHLVAMAAITIGDGTMIGENSSVRDANHQRVPGTPLRDAGHVARPIHIGREVWIGRGAAILAGVNIGDHATIAANAVVTRDVAAGAVVGGVPAVPLVRHT